MLLFALLTVVCFDVYLLFWIVVYCLTFCLVVLFLLFVGLVLFLVDLRVSGCFVGMVCMFVGLCYRLFGSGLYADCVLLGGVVFLLAYFVVVFVCGLIVVFCALICLRVLYLVYILLFGFVVLFC